MREKKNRLTYHIHQSPSPSKFPLNENIFFKNTIPYNRTKFVSQKRKDIDYRCSF